MIKLHTTLHHDVVSATPSFSTLDILFVLPGHFHIYSFCVSPILKAKIKKCNRCIAFGMEFLSICHASLKNFTGIKTEKQMQFCSNLLMSSMLYNSNSKVGCYQSCQSSLEIPSKGITSGLEKSSVYRFWTKF